METADFKNKTDIKSLTLSQLREEIINLGEQKFKALQIYQWLHQKKVTSFDDMTNISEKLRNTLSEKYYITHHKIIRKLSSKLDETQKYLFELYDGNCVETVLMKYNHAWSLCISTQVGCKMG